MLESDSDVFEKKSRCFLRGMEKTARGTYSRKNLVKVPYKTEYNLIRPFIEKVDGLSFCQSSLLLRTWLENLAKNMFNFSTEMLHSRR